MHLKDVPVPEPQDGEVLIRIGYSGVNPTDSKTGSGATRAHYRYVNFPLVTDMDAAGVVEQTGANVTDFRQGDRVITWASPDGKTSGSYAEFVRTSVRNVSPMPKSLNFGQAAAVPIASLTAFQSPFHAEKGRHDPGPEGAYTWGSEWCRQLRRTICEERRVAGGRDLRHPQRN